MNMPRIKAVAARPPTAIDISWKKGGAASVDLAGWIATGGDALAALRDPAVFARARVANYGAAVAWDDGDLAIDAAHLRLLAQEQRPFSASDAAAWQKEMGLSNQEAAEFLHISLSTWNAYKASRGELPEMVAMICRAARRDPLLMQAHYRPRKTGRPRKVVAS